MTAKTRKSEAFRNYALARERRVAVDEQWHDGCTFARLAAVLVLFGADLAKHNGIDNFEMRGVGG